MAMHYEIEVNIARPNRKGEPVWHPLMEANEDNKTCTWETQQKAIEAALDDKRLEFRVIRVDNNGTRTAFMY